MNIIERVRDLAGDAVQADRRPQAPARWLPEHFDAVRVDGPAWAPAPCVGIEARAPYASECGVSCATCEPYGGRVDGRDCPSCMPARWALWTMQAGHLPWGWHDVATRNEGWDKADRLLRGLDDHGYLLSGRTGSGKSHQAALLFWRAALRGIPTLWLPWDALNRWMVRSDDLPPWMDPGRVRQMRGLLVLDDLGSGKLTEWQQSNLVQLLDALDRSARLVITTNLGAGGPTSPFARWVGPRAASRIMGRCVALEVTR